MRLGLAHGRVDYKSMLDEIDEETFRDWMAFDHICPFGARQESEQLALVGAMLVNMQIAKGAKLNPDHFMPYTKAARERVKAGVEEEQSPELQIAYARQIAAAHNSGVR